MNYFSDEELSCCSAMVFDTDVEASMKVNGQLVSTTQVTVLVSGPQFLVQSMHRQEPFCALNWEDISEVKQRKQVPGKSMAAVRLAWGEGNYLVIQSSHYAVVNAILKAIHLFAASSTPQDRRANIASSKKGGLTTQTSSNSIAPLSPSTRSQLPSTGDGIAQRYDAAASELTTDEVAAIRDRERSIRQEIQPPPRSSSRGELVDVRRRAAAERRSSSRGSSALEVYRRDFSDPSVVAQIKRQVEADSMRLDSQSRTAAEPGFRSPSEGTRANVENVSDDVSLVLENMRREEEEAIRSTIAQRRRVGLPVPSASVEPVSDLERLAIVSPEKASRESLSSSTSNEKELTLSGQTPAAPAEDAEESKELARLAQEQAKHQLAQEEAERQEARKEAERKAKEDDESRRRANEAARIAREEAEKRAAEELTERLAREEAITIVTI